MYACREQAAALFGVGEPERVIFTLNATHALNIAINALVKPDSRVIVSGYEHNGGHAAADGLEISSLPCWIRRCGTARLWFLR